MHATRKVKLRDLSSNLTCHICHGYFIDATTIIECLHSFCKSCIVKALEKSEYCPVCDVQLHSSKPLSSIRSDSMLQEIVYKLVPGLFQNEMKSRREFYRKRTECRAKNNEDGGQVYNESYITSDDTIHLSLSLHSKNKKIKEKSRRYMMCPAAVSINILKKLLQGKYELESVKGIEIMYRERYLPDDFLLMDIAYKYSWNQNGGEPLELSYILLSEIPPQIPLTQTPIILKGQKLKRKIVDSEWEIEKPCKKSMKSAKNHKNHIKSASKKSESPLLKPENDLKKRGRPSKRKIDLQIENEVIFKEPVEKNEKNDEKIELILENSEEKSSTNEGVELKISESGVMSVKNIFSGEEKILTSPPNNNNNSHQGSEINPCDEGNKSEEIGKDTDKTPTKIEKKLVVKFPSPESYRKLSGEKSEIHQKINGEKSDHAQNNNGEKFEVYQKNNGEKSDQSQKNSGEKAEICQKNYDKKSEIYLKNNGEKSEVCTKINGEKSDLSPKSNSEKSEVFDKNNLVGEDLSLKSSKKSEETPKKSSSNFVNGDKFLYANKLLNGGSSLHNFLSKSTQNEKEKTKNIISPPEKNSDSFVLKIPSPKNSEKNIVKSPKSVSQFSNFHRPYFPSYKIDEQNEKLGHFEKCGPNLVNSCDPNLGHFKQFPYLPTIFPISPSDIFLSSLSNFTATVNKMEKIEKMSKYSTLSSQTNESTRHLLNNNNEEALNLSPKNSEKNPSCATPSPPQTEKTSSNNSA